MFNIEIISGEALQYQVAETASKHTMYFPGRIVVDGIKSRYEKGERRIQCAMSDKPSYKPVEGDL